MKRRLEIAWGSASPRSHRSHRSRSTRTWWSAGAALIAWWAPLTARAENYASSLEIGVASEADPGYATARFLQAAYRHAPATPGTAGLDFSCSIWAPAYVMILPELDFAYNVPLGRNAFVSPRFGGTVLLAGSGAYSVALPGINAGIGLAILGEQGGGMRMDVGVRRFGLSSRDHEHFWSASVGYLFSPN